MLNEIIGVFFCIIGIVFFAHHIFHKPSSIPVPGPDPMVPPESGRGRHEGVKRRLGRAWNNHQSRLLLAAAAVFIIICIAVVLMPPPAPSGENVTRAFSYELDGEPGEIVLTLNPAVYAYYKEKGSIPVTTRCRCRHPDRIRICREPWQPRSGNIPRPVDPQGHTMLWCKTRESITSLPAVRMGSPAR